MDQEAIGAKGAQTRQTIRVFPWRQVCLAAKQMMNDE